MTSHFSFSSLVSWGCGTTQDLQNQQHRLQSKGLLWNLLIRFLFPRLVLFVTGLLGAVCGRSLVLGPFPVDFKEPSRKRFTVFSRRTFSPTSWRAASTRVSCIAPDLTHVEWPVSAMFMRGALTLFLNARKMCVFLFSHHYTQEERNFLSPGFSLINLFKSALFF